MIVAGIDMGYRDIKVLILRDGEVLAKKKAPGGFEPGKVAEELLRDATDTAGLSQNELERIGVTGIGIEFAPRHDVEITDVGATTKGAHYIFLSARTVIDCGAEDSRGMKCTEEGKAADFATNDKCAAGAGAFTEAMARALEVSLEDFGKMALESTEAIPVNSQCAIFAESEVVSLIHRKVPKADISRAICDALGGRVGALVQRLGVEKDIVVVGGMARIPGFIESLKQRYQSQKTRSLWDLWELLFSAENKKGRSKWRNFGDGWNQSG